MLIQGQLLFVVGVFGIKSVSPLEQYHIQQHEPSLPIVQTPDQRHDVLSAIKVSPECWKMATTIVQKTHHQLYTEDTTRMCELLPEAHQKRLALEIARCHLQDLGRPLYRSSTTERECSTNDVNLETVQMCLKQLTDSGENAYTQYISYIQILCIQLTQEAIIQGHQKVKDEVASTYAEISGQSIAHMKAMSLLAESHADQMKTIADIPAKLQDQLSRELKDQLKETLDSQLRQQINEMLRTQALEQANVVEKLMGRLELRDAEQQGRVDDWTHYQSAMWQSQAQEMEKQRVALNEQRLRMESLSEAVSVTSQNMQPLVSIQSLITLALEGYSWITFLFHVLGTFNICWIITHPKRCHRFRSYLLGLVMAEALLEFGLATAVSYDMLSDAGRIACVADLRRWAILLESITYLFGLVGSFINVASKPTINTGYFEPVREPERIVDNRLGSHWNSYRPCDYQRPPDTVSPPYNHHLERYHNHNDGDYILDKTPYRKSSDHSKDRVWQHRASRIIDEDRNGFASDDMPSSRQLNRFRHPIPMTLCSPTIRQSVVPAKAVPTAKSKHQVMFVPEESSYFELPTHCQIKEFDGVDMSQSASHEQGYDVEAHSNNMDIASRTITPFYRDDERNTIIDVQPSSSGTTTAKKKRPAMTAHDAEPCPKKIST